MHFSSFFRFPQASANNGAVPVATLIASSSQRAARAITPAILALGALSLGVLGLRAQSSAPPTIAVSRHALNNNGRIEGSAQQLLGENLNLNSGAFFGGDLKVPGSPKIKINGKPNWDGQKNGGGSRSPSNYTVTLKNGATLGSLVTQSDPIALDNVATPPNSRGTRSVNINNAGDVAAIGAWNSVRDLTINGNVDVAVPAGTYGNFNVNNGALILGTPNDSSPDVYNFQNLNFNSGSRLKCVGPIIVTVRNSMNVNGVLGSSQNQAWLQLNISNGGLNINSGATIYGAVRAPGGSVQISGTVWGSVQADRLTVNSGGAIKLGAIVQPTPVPTPLPTATPVPTATPKPAPTATPVPTAIPVPTPTGVPLTPVTPILECVENLGNGQYRAHFGTDVPGTQTQIIPVGSTAANENQFAPAPIDRDQPTSFVPGRTRDSFAVDFSGSNLTWTLRGRTVTASAHSNGCPVPTPTPTVAPTATPLPLPTATPTPIPNRAPVATSDNYAVDEDGTLTTATPGVLSNDSDADGDNFEAQLVANPTHGTLELFLNGGFSYVPAANFNGADSFTYRANDGALQSNVATVTIAVSPVNDAPVAADVDGGTLTLSETRNGTLSATDVDDDASVLTYALVDAPAHGEATVNANGTFSYRVTPGTFYAGADSFSYRATDASGAVSNLARVTFDIAAPPAPIARDDQYATTDAPNYNFNGASVLANDSGDGPLTLRVVATTANGSLTPSVNGGFSYYPNNGFLGDDSFTYRAVDARGATSEIATVTIRVTHTNHGIYPVSEYYSVGPNAALRVGAPGVLGNDIDSDIANYGDRFGDKLTATLLTTTPDGVPLNPNEFLRYGTVDLRADGSFDYTLNSPLPTQDVSDSFLYKISDGQGAEAIGRVIVRIQLSNQAPVAQNQTIILPAGRSTVGVALSATDADNDPVNYELLTLPKQGTLRTASGSPLNVGGIYPTESFYYERTAGIPSSGASSDSFLFRARDSRNGYSQSATVTIRFGDINTPPVAVDDTATTTGGAITIAVLQNDTDADGDDLRVYYVDRSSLRAGATVTIAADGKTVIYNPGPNFAAGTSDTFTYGIGDRFSPLVMGRVTVRQVLPGGVDAWIRAIDGNDFYSGVGIVNGDASGQTVNGTTTSAANYPGAGAYLLNLRNTSQSYGDLILRGPAREPGATAQTAHWSVRYFVYNPGSSNSYEITDQVTSSGGWNTDAVSANNPRTVRVEVRPDATIPVGATLSTLFTLRSKDDDAARDVVGAVTTKSAATAGG